LLGPFLRPIKRAALLIKVILNSLLHRLERAWINLGVLAGKELNGPLIDQFFGGVLLSHPHFASELVNSKGRDLGVWMLDQKLCIDRAATAENQSRVQSL